MSAHVRIQLSRRKGFRLPPNTVNVARPGKWGNPWRVGIDGDAEVCVGLYRRKIESNKWSFPTVADVREQLRGKNLACWCKLPKKGEPDICHAAVLLELANK